MTFYSFSYLYPLPLHPTRAVTHRTAIKTRHRSLQVKPRLNTLLFFISIFLSEIYSIFKAPDKKTAALSLKSYILVPQPKLTLYRSSGYTFYIVLL